MVHNPLVEMIHNWLSIEIKRALQLKHDASVLPSLLHLLKHDEATCLVILDIFL